MLSEEEKKAIEIVKEIKDIRGMRKDVEGENEDLFALDIVINLIEKQQKEIEELKKQLDLDNECEIALNNRIMDLENRNEKLYEDNLTLAQELKEVISVDKIKTILGIEEDIDNEKLLSLLQTIVDENARLEDIEDRKVQIEYNNVFNKGVKSVEDKIKAKVIEVKNRNVKDEFITASQGKLNTIIDIESLLESD